MGPISMMMTMMMAIQATGTMIAVKLATMIKG